MKKTILATLLCLFCSLALAEDISATSEGYAESTAQPGQIVVRFATADRSKVCYIVVASTSRLAESGTSATVSVSSSGAGSWTVVGRDLVRGSIVARLNARNGQSCLLATNDEITYPLSATFEVTVH